ncbi:PAS domain-containing protein [Haloplanus salinarum]|uniref:receiver/sensor box histidine kinase n=1 Tax=Haloplanus salinarum TaxID=1912324 RepID=UPI00214BE2F4|nr:PAS domain-containing protein [Haloplanus salinarum]
MPPNDPERSGDGVSDLVRRRALDAAPLGVVITDPTAADNPIVYANDAFYRLTGYGPEETLGRNCRFLQGPETDPDRIAELRAAVDAAESASTVLRNYRRDGSVFWNHVEITPLTDDGTVSHFVGFQHDVTHLKRRERELVERQRRFETLHDASRGLMDATTFEEVARITADAAKHILEYPHTTLRLADEAGGLLRTAIATEESVAEAGARPNYRIDGDTPAARVYRTGEPLLYDELAEVDDGYDRGDFRAGMYLPVGEYGVLSVGDTDLAAFDDADLEITGVLAKLVAGALSRLESERALQRRNERLERFANIVAHDLRNPLGIARGRLELARETRDSDDLAAVDRAHDRMSALIDDLLTLARDGGPVTDADADSLELERIVRECWRHVETPNAELRVDDSRPVRADEGRLRRLIENLIRNSVEHGSTSNRTESGDDEGSEVPREAGETGDAVEHGFTSSRPAADDGLDPDDWDALTVTVGALDDFVRGAGADAPTATEAGPRRGFYLEDDGVGVPEGRRERIFDDGYSTDPSGTGFGLSIVREIADAHDWTVRVTESETGGARFEFRGVEGARRGSSPAEP